MTTRSTFRALTLVLLTLLWACQTRQSTEHHLTGQGPRDKEAGPGRAGLVSHFDVKGVSLGDGLFVGAGKTYDNLTIFPVLARSQTDVGPLRSLHDALSEGTAEVRELGTGSAAPSVNSLGDGPPQQQAVQQQAVQQQAGGAEVGKLVIENQGAVPVYVLAGTIVKGGKQDRQIGQDFIIGSKSTVPIDAFCVEHGRWDGSRNGKATGGKFTAVEQLANSDVRVAGQYKGDQREVWSKVSEVNKANGKHSDSDSLLATADDADVKRQRDQLRGRVFRDLDEVQPKGSVVGYAYAIGGEVRGVRWFAHHRIFTLFREVLVNTAIVDAITAKSAHGTQTAEVPSAESVAAFVVEAKKVAAAPEVRATSGDNTNEYKESAEAYQSTTTYELEDDSPATPKGKAKKKVKMSVDFVKKK